MKKSFWLKLGKLVLDFFIDAAIVLSLLCFILGVMYYMDGSLEMFPSGEQMEKAKIGAVMMMTASGIPCIGLTVLRAYLGLKF